MYKVGTRLLSFADERRIEKLGPHKGPRYVGARLYYPAKVSDEKLVSVDGKTYGEMYDNPPVLTEGPFPVIVYNHGYGAYLESNNYLCCRLASEGFFVVAAGHAYECEEIIVDDGESVKLDPETRKLQVYPRFVGTIEALKVKGTKGDPSTQARAFLAYQEKYCSFLCERLEEWAMDVNFLMGKLEEEYKDYMAKEKGYGITGHSFGGCLAYYMCQHFENYSCGADMDGAIFGDYSGMIMKKPFLLTCSEGNVAVTSRALIDTLAPVTYEVIEGASHLSFIDLKYYREKGFMMGKISFEEISGRINSLHLAFFNNYLK